MHLTLSYTDHSSDPHIRYALDVQVDRLRTICYADGLTYESIFYLEKQGNELWATDWTGLTRLMKSLSFIQPYLIM